MTNNIGGPVLTVHCKSKDDDLGVHMVASKTDYHFSFQPNIWKTTLFFCSFQWNDQVKQFDIFDAPRDQDDGYKFNWTIKPDSPCKIAHDQNRKATVQKLLEGRKQQRSMEVEKQSNKRRKLPEGICRGVELLQKGMKRINEGLSEMSSDAFKRVY
ncbi:unnamed protein product [Brassica rapa subsp. trilocularis]|uniref:S-protein homolog n=2 Tax=Brassica TaxID=3705 RepID=A0A078JXV3_BRANA|nr:unnamed protein product [Brassica napus]CDY70276.1 BnaAnng33170D [Brassica napus]